HAALLREPDADVHALELGEEAARKLEILEDPLPVRRAHHEARRGPARALGTEVERELLEEPGAARPPARGAAGLPVRRRRGARPATGAPRSRATAHGARVRACGATACGAGA